MERKPSNFSEVAGTAYAQGPLKMDDLVGKRITVLGYTLGKGQFGPRARIRVIYQGAERILITGSSVVLERLGAVKEHFPVVCTVKKPGRYYTIE